MVKRLPTMWEAWFPSLGWEDPLEKEMATHSCILAWKISWTEEPGRLQFMGSQRVRHDWVTSHEFNHIWRAKVKNWTDWSKLYNKGVRKIHITHFLWREKTQHTHVKRRLQIFVFTRKFQLIPRIPPTKDILVRPFGIYGAFSQDWVSTESSEFSFSYHITRHPSKGRFKNLWTNLQT